MFGLFRRNDDEVQPQSYEELRNIHSKVASRHTDDKRLVERVATAKAREAKGYQLFESDRQAIAEFDRESRKDAPPAPSQQAPDWNWKWWECRD